MGFIGSIEVEESKHPHSGSVGISVEAWVGQHGQHIIVAAQRSELLGPPNPLICHGIQGTR